jgi:hypothetical protein
MLVAMNRRLQLLKTHTKVSNSDGREDDIKYWMGAHDRQGMQDGRRSDRHQGLPWLVTTQTPCLRALSNTTLAS